LCDRSLRRLSLSDRSHDRPFFCQNFFKHVDYGRPSKILTYNECAAAAAAARSKVGVFSGLPPTMIASHSNIFKQADYGRPSKVCQNFSNRRTTDGQASFVRIFQTGGLRTAKQILSDFFKQADYGRPSKFCQIFSNRRTTDGQNNFDIMRYG
jgi:hypothetical protein